MTEEGCPLEREQRAISRALAAPPPPLATHIRKEVEQWRERTLTTPPPLKVTVVGGAAGEGGRGRLTASHEMKKPLRPPRT